MRPPPKRLAHRSIDYRRTRYSVREAAFASVWEEENRKVRGINFGGGVLQDLMVDQRNGRWRARIRHWIDNRTAAIVATVVQWLGTNVGFCFLDRALKLSGYVVRPMSLEDYPNHWITPSIEKPRKSGRYVVLRGFGRSEAEFVAGVPGFGYFVDLYSSDRRELHDVTHWLDTERFL